MEPFHHKYIAFIIILLGAILLCACSASGRTGVGPYDFTDYDSLDAQQEMREAQYEMTRYPVDDYYDNLFEQQATEAASEALSDYLYEEYLREQESGE